MLDFYDPADHYWIVAGDETQVWSSARAMYVPLDDPQYLVHLTFSTTSRIHTEAELWSVLRSQAPHKIPPAAYNGSDVNEERGRRLLLGTTVEVPGIGPIALDGREEDMRNLQGLAFGAQLRLAAGDTATLTPFRDGNNVVHMLSPMQILGLWQGGAAYVSAVYQASWSIKELGSVPADFRDDQWWP